MSGRKLLDPTTYIYKQVESMGIDFRFLITWLATRLAVKYTTGPVDPEVEQLSAFAEVKD